MKITNEERAQLRDILASHSVHAILSELSDIADDEAYQTNGRLHAPVCSMNPVLQAQVGAAIQMWDRRRAALLRIHNPSASFVPTLAPLFPVVPVAEQRTQ